MRLAAALAVCVLATGCVSAQQVNRANYAIDAAWQKGYDRVIEEHGTRVYGVEKDVAFRVFKDTLQDMDMFIEERRPDDGFIMASALAPRPLSDEQWEEISRIEEPKMKDIVREEVGDTVASMYYLDADSYRVLMGAMISDHRGNSIITMQGSMEYIGGMTGIRFPETLPPMATRLGVAKIWQEFSENLEEAGYSAQPIDESPDLQAAL